MVAKCANPACNRRFLYLHDGRLFAIDVYEKEVPLDSRGGSEFVSAPRKARFFWLCNECCEQATRATVLPRAAGAALKPLVPHRIDTSYTTEDIVVKKAA